jgi:hypothetical protein
MKKLCSSIERQVSLAAAQRIRLLRTDAKTRAEKLTPDLKRFRKWRGELLCPSFRVPCRREPLQVPLGAYPVLNARLRYRTDRAAIEPAPSSTIDEGSGTGPIEASVVPSRASS